MAKLVFSLADIRDDEEIDAFVEDLLDQLGVPKDVKESFPDHKGRPGEVGGSLPKGNSLRSAYPEISPAQATDSKWQEQLSKDEIESLHYYTVDGSTEINPCLRRNEGCTELKLGYVRFLDKALSNASFPTNATIFREMTEFKDFEKLVKPGVIFSDKWFVSTSLHLESMRQVIFEIKINKGAKAAFIGPYSSKIYEREVLLPRGSKFKILNVRQRRTTPLWHTIVQAELL